MDIRNKKPLFAFVVSFVMISGFMGFGWLLASQAPALMGFETTMIGALERCSEVVQAVGKPIHVSAFGWNCGNARVSGAFGNATWTSTIRGPLGWGSADFVGFKMGEWHVVQLVARVQNKEIDVVDCVNKSLLSDQEGEKTSWPRYVQMRVKQRVGNAPLSEQALCKAEMISIDVAKMGCQVKIECQDADGARQPIGWDFQAYCMPGFTIVSQETAEKPSLLLTLAPPQARGGNLSRQIASEQWVIGFEIQELLEE